MNWRRRKVCQTCFPRTCHTFWRCALLILFSDAEGNGDSRRLGGSCASPSAQTPERIVPSQSSRPFYSGQFQADKPHVLNYHQHGNIEQQIRLVHIPATNHIVTKELSMLSLMTSSTLSPSQTSSWTRSGVSSSKPCAECSAVIGAECGEHCDEMVQCSSIDMEKGKSYLGSLLDQI